MRDFRRIRRIRVHLRWLAVCLVVCGGVAGFHGAAAGAERVQFAGVEPDSNAPALSLFELRDQRGTGSDSQTLSPSRTEVNLAVILWDEWPREFKPSSGGTSGSLNQVGDGVFSSSVSGSP